MTESRYGRFFSTPAFGFLLRLVPVWAFSVIMLFQSSFAGAADLMQVLTLAQDNDPVLRREAFKHEAAAEILKQAYSELLPDLTAEGIYKYTNQDIKETDIAVFGDGSTSYPSKGYSLTLAQPLFKLTSILRVGQAKEQVKQADLVFEASRQDLLLKVSEVYMGVLEAQDNLAFTRAEETAVALHFELAQSKYRSGLVPVMDFHDAKARLADVSAMIVKTENRLDDALSALAELTGIRLENLAGLQYASLKNKASLVSGPLPGGRTEWPQGAAPAAPDPKPEGSLGTEQKPMPLVGPDPDDLGKWIKAAPRQSLEVEVQRREVEVAQREIGRQKAGHYPVVSMVGRYNRNDEGGSLFGGESDVATTEAYVQMTLPLYQGNSVRSRTREAIKRHEAAKADLDREIRSAERRTRAAFLGVKTALENMEAYKQSVTSYQHALEAKREGFKSGLFPILAVLDAERDLHRARWEYARAHYEYIINGLRLKRSVAILNSDDLAWVNRFLE